MMLVTYRNLVPISYGITRCSRPF